MKITKKLFKETEVRNLRVNVSAHNFDEYKKVVDSEYTFFLREDDLRVSLSGVKELKIVLHYGMFDNVAIMEDGTEIYVEL